MSDYNVCTLQSWLFYTSCLSPPILRTPSHQDRSDFDSLINRLEKVEKAFEEICHSGGDDSVAMKLGAPLEEGAEMYKELQKKYQRSSLALP